MSKHRGDLPATPFPPSSAPTGREACKGHASCRGRRCAGGDHRPPWEELRRHYLGLQGSGLPSQTTEARVQTRG